MIVYMLHSLKHSNEDFVIKFHNNIHVDENLHIESKNLNKTFIDKLN